LAGATQKRISGGALEALRGRRPSEEDPPECTQWICAGAPITGQGYHWFSPIEGAPITGQGYHWSSFTHRGAVPEHPSLGSACARVEITGQCLLEITGQCLLEITGQCLCQSGGHWVVPGDHWAVPAGDHWAVPAPKWRSSSEGPPSKGPMLHAHAHALT